MSIMRLDSVDIDASREDKHRVRPDSSPQGWTCQTPQQTGRTQGPLGRVPDPEIWL